MNYFIHSYNAPIHNLALDDYLLQHINQDPTQFSNGLLRLWESPTYFVVLGRSKKIADDVNEDQCNTDKIPILRRCSGGGTVLQGPGCFNYSFCLPINHDKSIQSINGTTTFVLGCVQRYLQPLLPNITLNGLSDLTINNL